MFTIKECREYLGDSGKDLSENQVEELRDNIYQITDIVLDNYITNKLYEKNKKK